MNILRIDTSDNLITRVELELDKKVYTLEEKRGKPGDQNVLELIDTLVKKQGVTLKDVNSIQVKTGSGSFTGLRVGASIANALSFALGVRIDGKKLGEIITPEY